MQTGERGDFPERLSLKKCKALGHWCWLGSSNILLMAASNFLPCVSTSGLPEPFGLQPAQGKPLSLPSISCEPVHLHHWLPHGYVESWGVAQDGPW